ncbi:MAG: two-component system, OmpR family, response regulator RegX3 [Actinomycetota bacterium]|jgi:two-component system response regulator RegX3|nr:two-component system, OmpR family, response regulator RegX3 [Actinomycetota bacterium]
MPRVLLVEDEESLGEALEYQLAREGYDVDRARDGVTAMTMFQASGSDLVLLDLMLPGMSGEDICKEIRRTSRVPIIMLTARDDDIDKVVGLELGADDYITKPFNTRELLARMRAVLRRSGNEQPSESVVLEGGGIRLDPDRFEVTVRGESVHLPRKEFELLELLMENAGRVLTRDTLIDQIWGPDYFGDTRTLDVHVKRLRAKFEEQPGEPRHLITIRGLGYKFTP